MITKQRTRFNQGGPSDWWFRQFFKRHKDKLKESRPNHRNNGRATMANETVISNYFKLLGLLCFTTFFKVDKNSEYKVSYFYFKR